MQLLYRIFKALVRSCAGILGGFAVGGILFLVLYHLVSDDLIDVPSKYLAAFAFAVSIAAGLVFPKQFWMFLASPLAWPIFLHDSGYGLRFKDIGISWTTVLFNIAYMLGLILLILGVLSDHSGFVGLGVLGIITFAVGVFRTTASEQGEPD